MFQSISWIEFGTVIGLITLGYYLIVGLLLYSSEIKNSFTRGTSMFGAHSQPNQSESKLTDTLMGGVKHGSSPEPVSREVRVDAHEVVVSSNVNDEEAIDFVSEREQSLQSDEQTLLAEVQILIDTVSAENKEEAATLFSALFERYGHVTDSAYRDHISLLVHKRSKDLGLQFAQADVKSWWPSL